MVPESPLTILRKNNFLYKVTSQVQISISKTYTQPGLTLLHFCFPSGSPSFPLSSSQSRILVSSSFSPFFLPPSCLCSHTLVEGEGGGGGGGGFFHPPSTVRQVPRGKGEKRKIHFHYYCRGILLKWGAS